MRFFQWLAPAAATFAPLASAQVGADAGADQSVVHPQSAALVGTVLNGSPLHWWTADGNNATEDMLLKWVEGSGLTAVGPIRTSGGTVYGWPGDLTYIGSTVWGVDVGQRRLYTLDGSTGICTLIGTSAYASNWSSVNSLAYDQPHDRLFAVDTGKKQLLRFNRTTGQATAVGSVTLTGYPLVRALAYRASDNRLYAVDEATNWLLRLDPDTGAVTPIVIVQPDPLAQIEELDFFQGQLFATKGISSGGNLIAAELLALDMSTGVTEVLGSQIPDCSPHCNLIQSLPEAVAWSQQRGPGNASFADASSAATSVSFSQPGEYVLEFTVFAVVGSVSDTVTVTSDGCPNDPQKSAPGICGCGVADVDSDADGTPDCLDGCASDPQKVEPGTCGCGVPDVDTDADGTLDCLDGCPTDPQKVAAGTCGCGVSDVDSDADGTPDCLDGCPNDPSKLAPGACGCGVAETDSDGDGVPDCIDGCASDPLKSAPGACGCGNPETDGDGDGTPDCVDGCPNDPLKSAPGACGCGFAESDGDGDGVPDCVDNCPAHLNVDQSDCDGDGAGDVCEIAGGTQFDLNSNGLPDDCEGGSGTVFCAGDGSATACPCTNVGAADSGCANSTGVGAKLTNLGGASVAFDNALLECTQLPPDKSGLVYMGTATKNNGLGVTFGDGLRCVAGQLQRFPVQSSGAGGVFQLAQLVAASGGQIASGSTWHFQVWYRDVPLPCGDQINLSNGYTITFVP